MSDDCVIWHGPLDRDGYGRGSNGVLAHRKAYESARGPIPEGLTIDHLCRNRACVNPEHLEPVTHAENVRRGVKHRPSVLATHCHAGHEFTPENTYLIKGRSRQCRACNRAAVSRYKTSRKAAAS